MAPSLSSLTLSGDPPRGRTVMVPREEVYVHASTGYASSLPMAKGQDVRNR